MEHVDRKSPEMRTDGDFIHQLREEIANTQERRVRFIKAKLAFAVALLGVGGISIGPLNNTTVLLYLIPFVTFVASSPEFVGEYLILGKNVSSILLLQRLLCR